MSTSFTQGSFTPLQKGLPQWDIILQLK